MSLSQYLYKTLENVVGPENISDREWVQAAYRHPSPGTSQKPASPEAVILPGSTEEVQAIIKICNRYKIKYVPMTSLFSAARGNQSGMVILNLQRMNRIIEINEKDRYAVIEPGVRHVQLKPELMKRGLTYPTASVGPAASVLANFVQSGDHHIQHGSSRVNRYLLGMEWVLPSGEILKVGSPGNDAGWFCQDGPGPSLRGLFKGYGGWSGGMGIATKIAVGLDDWKGPRVMPGEGHSPSYRVPLPKDCHKIFIFKFPTLDKVRDAMLEMGKAEIGSAVLKFFYATEAALTTESANDFWRVWNSGLYQKELPLALWVYLATWTPEEMAYEESVMWDIVRENQGAAVDESIRQKYDDNADHMFIIVSFLQRVLRLGGGWWGTKLGADSVSHMFEVAKVIPEFFDEYIQKGMILDAPFNFQIVPMEYGHMAHIELLFFYDLNLPGWQKIVPEIARKSSETDIRHGYHSSTPMGPNLERLGPLYSNFNVWQEKIKTAFDPNTVAKPNPTITS
jgi:glycolate oxidase